MKAEIVATISNRLNEALRLRKMSQVDLCKRSGLSKSSISSYLSGRYEPRGDRIFLLASALDVNPVWLSGFDVPINAPKREIVEEQLVTDFRTLSEDDQKKAIEYVKLLKKAAE